jgi:restriction endonuclease S subunit
MDQWWLVTVPVPPEAEQRAIAAFLDRETARIDAAVTGKIDVSAKNAVCGCGLGR